MVQFRAKRVIPIILVFVIAIIVIVALFSIARGLFFSNDSNTSSTDPGQTALISTTAANSVKMTVRGPLVADEDYRSYQITITPSTRDMTTYQGYNDNRIDGQDLANTTQAYEQFVYALSHADLAKGTPLTGDANDTRGVCATGELYTFDIMQGSQVVKELWTSSCSGSEGSLDANLDQVTNLFTAQIPNATSLASNVNL